MFKIQRKCREILINHSPERITFSFQNHFMILSCSSFLMLMLITLEYKVIFCFPIQKIPEGFFLLIQIDLNYILYKVNISFGFPNGSVVKNPPVSEGEAGDPWVVKIPWRTKWQPTPVFLPGESMDRGVWWTAVYGVAQSQTQLKQLSTHAYFV